MLTELDMSADFGKDGIEVEPSIDRSFGNNEISRDSTKCNRHHPRSWSQ